MHFSDGKKRKIDSKRINKMQLPTHAMYYLYFIELKYSFLSAYSSVASLIFFSVGDDEYRVKCEGAITYLMANGCSDPFVIGKECDCNNGFL
jgi:hypothetical protein